MSKAHAFSMGPIVWFTGVVEDINDPKQLGRAKVRMYGYHSASTSDIPTADLMWALVGGPTTSSNTSGIGQTPHGLVNGTTVYGWFLDGEDAQMPLVIGTLPGAPAKGPQAGTGFNDPDGVYPNYDAGESDINRLARGSSNVDMLNTKQSNQLQGVQTAGSGPSWSQPKTPYAAKYPHNQVRETTAGHIEEFDSTPGAERINRFHKSGTFEEIGPDGTKVTQIVKDNYSIVAGDDYISITGKCFINIGGDCRLQVAGDAYIDVAGKKTEVIAGDYDLKIGGTMNLTVGADYNNTASGTNTTRASTIMLN